jgi:N-acetylmuramoyl-L-alanine amidase
LKNFDRRQRALRSCAALLSMLLAAIPVLAGGKSEDWARTQFANAERVREALNGRPAADRSRPEYQRAIAAYRRVYYEAPASTRADPSVAAVAELLVEMGRRCDDDGILRSAIRQYEFLRREYPGSRYRISALFTIGEIYKDDLDEPGRARAAFNEFLRLYPHHHLADDARAALTEPVQQSALRPKHNQDSEDTDDSSAGSLGKNPKKDSRAAREMEDRASTTNLGSGQAQEPEKLARVTSIRHWSTPDYTRVAIDVEQDVRFESRRIDRPNRIVFDLSGTRLASTLVGKSFDVDDGFLKQIRVAQFQPGKARIVLEVDDFADYNAFLLSNPSRLIIDIHGKQQAKSEPKTKPASKAGVEAGEPPQSRSVAKTAAPKIIVEADDGEDDETQATKLEPPPIRPASKTEGATSRPPLDQVSSVHTGSEPASGARTSSKSGKSGSSKNRRKTVSPELDARAARPTASGDRSLIRALGLKIGKIVIDPGHGGHDTGTIGPNGLEEKDLVLEVGRRLGKLLETRMDARVAYTRKDDTFIPLETRTAIANQAQADLFVSIHANSSRDPDARGVETYYLNFTSSSEALDVAARENAASDKSIHELQDLVKKIALKEKVEESREFAIDVQRSLHSGLAAKSPGIRDRGVKKAPFVVLIGANMPSILAEISFVSNPADERRLETAEYRQRIAESLYRGIAKYVSGLSGVRVASRIEKSEGP